MLSFVSSCIGPQTRDDNNVLIMKTEDTYDEASRSHVTCDLFVVVGGASTFHIVLLTDGKLWEEHT